MQCHGARAAKCMAITEMMAVSRCSVTYTIRPASVRSGKSSAIVVFPQCEMSTLARLGRRPAYDQRGSS